MLTVRARETGINASISLQEVLLFLSLVEDLYYFLRSPQTYSKRNGGITAIYQRGSVNKSNSSHGIHEERGISERLEDWPLNPIFWRISSLLRNFPIYFQFTSAPGTAVFAILAYSSRFCLCTPRDYAKVRAIGLESCQEGRKHFASPHGTLGNIGNAFRSAVASKDGLTRNSDDNHAAITVKRKQIAFTR